MATRSLGQLTLDLVARIGGFEQGMDKAGRAAEKNFKRMRKEAQEAGSVIGKVLAFATAGAGFAAFIKNTVDAQNEQAQLAAVLRSTGEAAGYSQKQLNDMADSLAKTSTVSAGEINNAQTTLLAFTGIVGEEFPRALQAAVDMAARTGTSVVSAAETIGRALDIPSKGLTALSKQGFRFTDDQKRLAEQLEATGRTAEAQGIILSALEDSYGGAAQSARDTFGGAMIAVREAINDLFEAGPGQIDPLTESLNEFADTLRDPATVQAAQNLAGAIITGFNGAAEAIRGVVNVTQFLAEELGAITAGAAADDIVRLTEQLEKLQSMQANPSERLRFFGKDGLVEWYSKDELAREITLVKAQIAQAMVGTRPLMSPTAAVAAPSASSSNAPSIELASKEFERLSAQLRQQAALYGSVGEAAKIRYQIESGALKDLKAGEGEQLIRLAEQYDARVKAVQAMKEQEQAAKQLQTAFDGRIEQYARELALSGEITELERLRYDIARGALVGINAEQQARLEGLAKEVEALKQRKQLEQELSSVITGLRTAEEVALDTYIEKMNALNRALAEGAATATQYDDARRRVAEEYEKTLENLQDTTKEMSEYAKQAARNMQTAFAEFLFDPFDNGLKGMLENFGRILQRMAAEAAAAKIFESIGSWGKSNQRSGGWSGALAAIASFAGMYDAGGFIGAGQWGIVGERGPELVRGPAHITSRMDTPKMLGGQTTNNYNIVLPNARNRAEGNEAGGAAARQITRITQAGQRYS